MNQKRTSIRIALNYGLIAGVVSLSLCVIGMVEVLDERFLIAGVLTLGQVFLFAPIAAAAYLSAAKVGKDNRTKGLLFGAVTGLIAALPLVVLVIFATNFDLRQFLPNVSPALIEILTFGRGPIVGSLVLLIVSAVLGLLAAVMYLIPNRISDPILTGILWTLVIGLFSEFLAERIRNFFGVGLTRIIFTGKALSPIAALILFILITIFSAWWTLFSSCFL